MTVKLEIGGGTLAAPEWVNLDPEHGTPPDDPRIRDLLLPEAKEAGLRAYAQYGIPLVDDSVDEARASHVLEHIPAGHPRITVMNELHRVLTPGAVLHIALPVIGYEDPNGRQVMVENWRPYADPTHVSFWWWPHSLLYFVAPPVGLAPNADYGIRPWRLLDWAVGGDPFWEGTARMSPA